MHQALQGATFHVEHAVPRVLGGETDLANLAWACPSCNLMKGSRVGVLNDQTGEIIPFFNPRVHVWQQHFAWNKEWIVALSEIGETAISILQLNSERRRLIRLAEAGFGLFPPP